MDAIKLQQTQLIRKETWICLGEEVWATSKVRTKKGAGKNMHGGKLQVIKQVSGMFPNIFQKCSLFLTAKVQILVTKNFKKERKHPQ